MSLQPVCKRCNEVMDRIKRRRVDRMLGSLSFGILGIRRYYCYGCLKSRLLITRSWKDQKKLIHY